MFDQRVARKPRVGRGLELRRRRRHGHQGGHIGRARAVEIDRLRSPPAPSRSRMTVTVPALDAFNMPPTFTSPAHRRRRADRPVAGGGEAPAEALDVRRHDGFHADEAPDHRERRRARSSFRTLVHSESGLIERQRRVHHQIAANPERQPRSSWWSGAAQRSSVRLAAGVAHVDVRGRPHQRVRRRGGGASSTVRVGAARQATSASATADRTRRRGKRDREDAWTRFANEARTVPRAFGVPRHAWRRVLLTASACSFTFVKTRVHRAFGRGSACAVGRCRGKSLTMREGGDVRCASLEGVRPGSTHHAAGST